MLIADVGDAAIASQHDRERGVVRNAKGRAPATMQGTVSPPTSAFRCELHVYREDRSTDSSLAGGFANRAIDCGSPFVLAANDSLDELTQSRRERLDDPRTSSKAERPVADRQREAEIFDDLMRLNNELVNMQRELSRRNAELIERTSSLASANEALCQARQAADAANGVKQEQLEELEHLYRMAPVGLELLDRDFRVLRVNELLAAINGKPVHEHIGRTLSEIVPQFAAEIEAVANQVFDTGEPVQNIEVHGVTPADPATERDWLVSYYPVKAQDGLARYVGCVVLEITARKKIEVDLRRQKELLQSVIDHIPCAVFWKDRQSVNLGGNQIAASDLGFASPAEMIGKNNFDLPIARAEAESFTRFDRAVMDNGTPIVNREEVLTARDGRRMDVLTSKVPLRDATGEVFGVLAVYLDITDRKLAEQALAERAERVANEKWLNDLANALPQMVWTARPDGYLDYYNDRWYEYSGMPRGIGGDESWTPVFHPDDVQKCLDTWYPAVRAGRPYVLEYRLRERRTGRYRWHLGRAVPMRNEAGTIVRWIGTCTDIEDHKRAEEGLRHAQEELENRVQRRTLELKEATEGFRQNEQRYRTLVEATTAVAWSTGASGDVESELTGWAAFTGMPGERTLGRGWLEAIHPDDRTRTLDVWKAACSSRSIYSIEHRVRRSDGEFRHMMARAVPITNKDGAILEWVGAHIDLTEQKQVEGALRMAKDAAVAASRAKGEFLANMSHEIRTPMNGILGMTELTLDSDLTGEQRSNLRMVKTSADSLLHVINDILDFSKIEAGKLELDPVPFALRDSMDATIKSLSQRAQEKGLELICLIDADAPDGLIGDALRLRQIVTNLIGNAVKFTERGEVVFRVECDDDSAETAGLHFTVRDTGIGIPADKQRLIFEAFTQADGSTSRRFGGTGLGLAITLQLVALMDGRIWIESEVGKGSTFHVTVRLKKQGGQLRKPPASRAELERLRVLVVDDNPTNLAMLEGMLANWRMCPAVAGGGALAIACMKRAVADGAPFPLVLLDASMPEMDGFAVAEQIQRDPDLAGATIMMIASPDRSGDAMRCRELGVACCLRKPIAQSELFDAILVALGTAAHELPKSSGVPPVGIERGERALRILLAEDNEVNQVLAVRILHKRGHEVVLAGDGQEALAVFARETVDLVLMDVQMPEMDGFAATAAIREKERATGGHVPIVAVTAHAMKGDRERCRAAGMDAYVSKPLRSEDLFIAIASAISVAEALRPSVTVAVPPVDERAVLATYDPAVALDRVEGDRDLLQRMIDLFHTQAQVTFVEIRAAAQRRDGGALERFAHKIKGSIGCFGDDRAFEAAARLEAMGRNGELDLVEEAIASLEREAGRLSEALDAFIGEVPAGAPRSPTASSSG